MDSKRHRPAVLLALVLAVHAGAMPARCGDARAADPLVPLERFTHFGARGRTQAEVEKGLRAPDYRLSADEWVYWNCESSHPDDTARGFDTMIVSFVDGRVSGVRLAPRAWVTALIARLEANRAAAVPAPLVASPSLVKK